MDRRSPSKRTVPMRMISSNGSGGRILNTCNEREASPWGSASLALGHEQRGNPGCIGGGLCAVFLLQNTSGRVASEPRDGLGQGQ